MRYSDHLRIDDVDFNIKTFHKHELRKRIYGLVLLTIVFICMICLFSYGPIPQDVNYHNFADDRSFLFIPNFLNVISNIPFLFAGLYGIYALVYGNPNAFFHIAEKGTYWILFISVCFVSVGSAYYHLWPNTETLFWDRLPMTVGFMAVMSILFSEKVDKSFGQKALIPCLLTGVSSVLWWSFTEAHPTRIGDLRPYIVVQFAPVLLTPFIIMLYPNSYTHTTYMYISVALYVFAKIMEVLDKQIYSFLWNTVSGHTLKHVVAAYGIFLLAVMLQKRKPIKIL
jgi:hypothetical protein